LTTLAAAEGSSKLHAMPVIPLSCASSAGLSKAVPLSASFTSVFFTTRYSTPALRNSARNDVILSTFTPPKSSNTAVVALSKLALIAATSSCLACWATDMAMPPPFGRRPDRSERQAPSWS
jgi:hypothetical protein